MNFQALLFLNIDTEQSLTSNNKHFEFHTKQYKEVLKLLEQPNLQREDWDGKYPFEVLSNYIDNKVAVEK